MEVTRALANYVVRSHYADIPDAVKHEAARALLNRAGCAIGSSRHETVECAIVRDARVVALRQRVTAIPDPQVRKIAARVNVRLKDGRVLTIHVENALGTLARPMSDADLEAKCRGLTDGIISASQTDELIGLCWSVATLPDTGAIARTAAPSA